jgi:hypothetical protein
MRHETEQRAEIQDETKRGSRKHHRLPRVVGWVPYFVLASDFGLLLYFMAGITNVNWASPFSVALGFAAVLASMITTQEDQLAVFANAGAHLAPGGRFVVEVIVPQLRRVPRGEVAWVFTLDPGHVGIETFDDLVGQIAWSHHWIEAEGRLVYHSAPYRYVSPSELDLMARITGFRLRERWSGWERVPFTSDSQSQVAVFEKLP